VTIDEVIKAHPQPTSLDHDLLLRCIDECLDCGPACTGCADASLAEDDVQDLIRCIRLCLDCADACDSTSRILIRQTTPDRATQRATIAGCAAACRAAAEECERHAAHHEHCRLCAEACHRCEQACEDLLAAFG
jgi:hypothetical protein